MLSPHMGRENAFHLKSCLPVTSTQEVESVCGNWKYSSEVRFPHFKHKVSLVYCAPALHQQARCWSLLPLYLFILTICTFLSCS